MPTKFLSLTALLAALALLGGLHLPAAASTAPTTATATADAGSATPQSASAKAKKNRPCITRKEYVAVKKKMTLAKVAKIVGSRGKITHGDVALHGRYWLSCVTVDNERMPTCMLFARKAKADGTFGPARVRNKNIDCPSGY